MSHIGSFFRDRIGWQSNIKPFLEKSLPADLNWSFTLGSVCALLFFVQVLTGILLAMYYNPSPEHAYQSIDYIVNNVFMGRILRGMHYWTAGLMVVIVFLHMVTTIFYGAYKPPRELTWMIGGGLLLLTLAFGLTGYLLPWDQKAYWATVVSTNIPKEIPLLGEVITRALRGGQEVSGLTITRFYTLHIVILPALLLLFISAHIYLVRLHNIAGHWDYEPLGKQKFTPFFPDHVFKSAIAFSIIFLGIILLSIFVDPLMEEKAMTPNPSYLPRPEWYYMWLFKLLTFFPGKSEFIGSLLIPFGLVFLLFSLPFLSRTMVRRPLDRPLALALAVAGLVGLIYLSLIGQADSKPYGQIIMIPDRELTQMEMRGLRIWLDRDCAYCHNIKGKGGRLEGPDLSNVVTKQRTKEWLVRYIKDPKATSRWNTMPKYELSEEELSALAEFILALDFNHYASKAVSRTEIIGNGTSKQKN